MSATSLASYDEVPYTALPFAQSHPSRLATMARLFGIDAPPVATCRVLELGCALGGNVIPMAVAMPDATFVGIDLSARQIEDGRRIVDVLGLDNIELRHADIADVDASWGRFDYVIAHGIYSWVPAPIRERVLDICNANLVPNGVAYVSYNALPGWGIRRIVRDFMLWHSRGATTREEKIAQSRAALAFLEQHLPPDTPYAAVLREVLGTLNGAADAYINHDHLEDTNDAFYFHEFVDAAASHGLQYLGEAEFSAMAPQIPNVLKETFRQMRPDLHEREQYLDFLHHRSFRQTLLVHAATRIDRRIEPQTLDAFEVASPIQPASMNSTLAQGISETFRTPAGQEISTPSAISKAALAELGSCWPTALSIDDLVVRARTRLGPARDSIALADDARMLAIEMLQCYAAGVVEFRVWSPTIAASASARPEASPLARLQARRGPEVTNLLHRSITMNPFSRALLPLLDGSRDRSAIVAALETRIAGGEVVVPVRPGGVPAIVDETLAGLAKAALLRA